MATQQQRQQFREPQGRKHFPWMRLIIILIAILLFAAGAIIWILNIGHVIQGAWSFILPVIFTVLGVLFALFQWLFPINSSTPTPHIAFPPQPLPQRSPFE